MNVKLRIAMIIVIQTIALCLMIGIRQWTLNTGTPIVLETAPVDPRSLFSGDYVRLSYKISELRLDDLSGDREFRKDETVYVLLQEGTPYWIPVSIHRERPAASPGHVAIKGKVTSWNLPNWGRPVKEQNKPKTITVHYGIEAYYIPEGTGNALGRTRPGEKLSMRVAVDRFGNAGIKAVLVDGKPRYEETLF